MESAATQARSAGLVRTQGRVELSSRSVASKRSISGAQVPSQQEARPRAHGYLRRNRVRFEPRHTKVAATATFRTESGRPRQGPRHYLWHPDVESLTWPWVLLDIAVLPLLILAPLAVAGSVAAAIHAWYTRRWDWRLLLTAASLTDACRAEEGRVRRCPSVDTSIGLSGHTPCTSWAPSDAPLWRYRSGTRGARHGFLSQVWKRPAQDHRAVEYKTDNGVPSLHIVRPHRRRACRR